MKKPMLALAAAVAVAGCVSNDRANYISEDTKKAATEKGIHNISNETPEQKAARMAWWTHDRFGMFIHFGLYAMPARHEWIKSKEHITSEVYDEKYFSRFNPDLFDAKAWAKAAKDAGMKYMVFTTKHHEGFCNWDTKTTDYKITNTPFKRDLVREYVDACRAEGLKVGFYFSVIDWHHPDYRLDSCHPQWRDKATRATNLKRDMNKYREYMFSQVRELLTDYGKIDVMFFDFTPRGKTWQDWNARELVKMVRELQPGIIIDERLDLKNTTDDGWDFVTPEQYKEKSWPTVRGKRVPWETCQTFSGSWGYHRDEKTWKSVPQLLDLLVDSVSHGGNLILNVGPTARGEFDYRAKDRLDAIGKWMHANARSIYGCTQAPDEFKAPAGTILTWNPETKRLYLHLFTYPKEPLALPFADKIAYVQFLHDGSELFVKDGALCVPSDKPPVEVPVVEIFTK